MYVEMTHPLGHIICRWGKGNLHYVFVPEKVYWEYFISIFHRNEVIFQGIFIFKALTRNLRKFDFLRRICNNFGSKKKIPELFHVRISSPSANLTLTRWF